MTDKEITSRSIDILRFPLAVMIVMIHTYFNESLNRFGTEVEFQGVWAHHFIHFCSITITDCAVPMFFVISGYLFFLKDQHLTLGSYARKLKSKIYTLLIPYLAWNVVAICYGAYVFLDKFKVTRLLFCGNRTKKKYENNSILLVRDA